MILVIMADHLREKIIYLLYLGPSMSGEILTGAIGHSRGVLYGSHVHFLHTGQLTAPLAPCPIPPL
jgi:hypothetical protein